MFEDLLYQNVRQPGAQSSQQTNLPSGQQVGTGVRTVAIERIHTQGNPQQTNNAKDLMVNGAASFNVLLPDGTTAYTRDGSFQSDSNGQMVTSSGFVMSACHHGACQRPIDHGRRDGTVSVTLAGSTAPIADRHHPADHLRQSAGLESKGENLYVETGASGSPNTNTPGTNGAGVLMQGYVETSNVNVVEEMVNMIQTQRAYEINSKAITTSDQMLAKLSQL